MERKTGGMKNRLYESCVCVGPLMVDLLLLDVLNNTVLLLLQPLHYTVIVFLTFASGSSALGPFDETDKRSSLFFLFWL